MKDASSEDSWVFYDKLFRDSEDKDISLEELLLTEDEEAYRKIY